MRWIYRVIVVGLLVLIGMGVSTGPTPPVPPTSVVLRGPQGYPLATLPPTATATPTPTHTPTATPTATPTSTPTATATPTSTPVPPTATPTSAPQPVVYAKRGPLSGYAVYYGESVFRDTVIPTRLRQRAIQQRRDPAMPDIPDTGCYMASHVDDVGAVVWVQGPAGGRSCVIWDYPRMEHYEGIVTQRKIVAELDWYSALTVCGFHGSALECPVTLTMISNAWPGSAGASDYRR